MKRPARMWFALLLGLLAIGVANSALSLTQTPAVQDGDRQPAVPIVKANVREVLVPVVVTDQKGRHVTELKRSDFQVFEDGIAEDIVAFSTATDPSVSEAGNAGGARAANGSQAAQRPGPPSAAARRNYLICVDTLHSAFSNFGRVRDALTRVLREEESADSQYALMTLGRELRVVLDSTQDAPAVVAAIRSRNFQKGIQASEAANTASAAQQFTALMRSYCSACACQSNGGSAKAELPECPSFKSRVQAFLLASGERTYILDQNFLRQLSELVKATAGMPGNRTILLISDGFNRFPGQELYGIFQGFGPKDLRLQFNPRDTRPELQSVLKLATANDVKFYTLDSRGLYTAAFVDGNTLDASTSFSTPTQMDSRNP